MDQTINQSEIDLIRCQVQECLQKDEYSFEDMIFIYEKSREILYLYASLPEGKAPLDDLLFWHGNILDMKDFLLTYESAVQQDAELVMDIIEYSKAERYRPELQQSTGFLASFDSKAAAQKVLDVIRILLDIYAEKGVQTNEYKVWLLYYNQIAAFLCYPARGFAKEDLSRLTLEEAEFFCSEALSRLIAEIDFLPSAVWLTYVYVNLSQLIPKLKAAQEKNA